MYLLDTYVVSELRKPNPQRVVLAWLKSVTDRNLHFGGFSLGEIQAGIELTREQDAAKAAVGVTGPWRKAVRSPRTTPGR